MFIDDLCFICLQKQNYKLINNKYQVTNRVMKLLNF